MKRKHYIILRDVRQEKILRRIEALRTRKCANCGKPIPPNHRYYCSDTCRKLFHIKYKDYISWKELRRKVLERDNYTCVICGKPAEEIDHIVPISMGGAMFDMNNLQSLCKQCHKEKTIEDRRKLTLTQKLKHVIKLDSFIS